MPSQVRSSSGATLLVAMLAVPAEKVTTWRACSDAGSGLPWWTPIAVSGLLVLASVLYRFRHRPKDPGEHGLHTFLEIVHRLGKHPRKAQV
jgi:hypothetical protein